MYEEKPWRLYIYIFKNKIGKWYLISFLSLLVLLYGIAIPGHYLWDNHNNGNVMQSHS